MVAVGLEKGTSDPSLAKVVTYNSAISAVTRADHWRLGPFATKKHIYVRGPQNADPTIFGRMLVTLPPMHGSNWQSDG